MRCSRFFSHAAKAVCLVLLCTTVHAQDVGPQKRVAVLNFDNAGVPSGAYSGLFGADDQDVGKGVSVLLIQKLVEGGKYTVVDRSAVLKLLTEQNDADKEREDAYSMAARIGRLLNLDAMIIGGITRYGPEDKPAGAGSGGFGPVHVRKSKAFVEITVRVLNMSNAEILASFTGAGESTGSGSVTRISVGHSSGPQEMLGSEFVNSLLGEATRNAVEQIATQLNSIVDKIPVLRISVDGLVAEVAGDTITLNAGRKAGVRVGDRLKISRDVRPTADLAVSGVTAPVAQFLGEATITEVADDYATATFSGSGLVQVGDHAKTADSLPPSPPSQQ